MTAADATGATLNPVSPSGMSFTDPVPCADMAVADAAA
jgi:hypothetical protein